MISLRAKGVVLVRVIFGERGLIPKNEHMGSLKNSKTLSIM
jgi:hypothetical protein